MMRSMFSGVSGLRNHQTMMDVVGNNIANVNTAGFKTSQVTFAEAIAQTLSGAGGSTSTRSGVKPSQIGLGANLGSIDRVFTQGASQVTGRSTDLAIQGDGFFIAANGAERFYTRAGVFSFDNNGNMATAGGMVVQGWIADANGVVDSNRPVGGIRIPVGQLVEPEPTTTVQLGGNLSADSAVGDAVQSSISVFDSLGAAHEVQVVFTKTADNAWTTTASVDGNAVAVDVPAVTFDGTGALTSSAVLSITGFTPPGANPMAFTVDLTTGADLVQYGGQNTMEARFADGGAIGRLVGYTIGEDGTVAGQFSNGKNVTLARVATAVFASPGGLLQKGDGNFISTTQTGPPLIGDPGSGSRGVLAAGTLEMSNVDLAKEFTNLIIAQRGFQANSRVISTSDEMLADLVNLKR